MKINSKDVSSFKCYWLFVNYFIIWKIKIKFLYNINVIEFLRLRGIIGSIGYEESCCPGDNNLVVVFAPFGDKDGVSADEGVASFCFFNLLNIF